MPVVGYEEAADKRRRKKGDVETLKNDKHLGELERRQ